MRRRLLTTLLLSLFIFSFGSALFADMTAQKQTSGIERTREMQEQEKKLREKIESKKEAPKAEEERPVKAPAAPAEKALIRHITVRGAILIPEKDIRNIVEKFEGKEMDLTQMQGVADMITDLYRQKGYITSRAYVPPQKIENNILEIVVIEGRMGAVEVKGNRYFSSELLQSDITLKKGEPFNYNILRRDLAYINQSVDRSGRAVLMPGKEPGETDTLLEIRDRLPVHAGLDWDNYASRYIDKQRYGVRVSHNNLLGLDDSLSYILQLARSSSRYMLNSFRYLLPLNYNSQAGFYGALNNVKLAKEFEDIDIRGSSRIYGVFFNNVFVSEENANITLNLGYDYKDIKNYQFNALASYDRLRIAKAGMDADLTDNLGRTLITDEFDFGLPHTMGGLAARDPKASRDGAGGKFNKNTLNLFRLQKLPFSSTLLWKNQVQFSPSILTSAEEFQIGGVANVRGYPPAEAVGDSGYATTLEATIPAHFISKDVQVPFLKGRLYDTLKFAGFYDYATAHLKRPGVGEQKNKNLSSLGCGLRLNLPDDLNFRADLAWPLDEMPSDGHRLHVCMAASKSF